MNTVYLIHFAQPLAHARHYVGWTSLDVAQRLEHHRTGRGARLLEVLTHLGIGFEVVRVWEGQGRTFERRLKNCKHAARYCPVCAGEKALTRMKNSLA